MKKRIQWKVLITCLAAVYIIAFIASLFTNGVVDSEWYKENRPSFTPPNFIFPIVWNVLFFLISISLYIAWTSTKDKTKKQRIASIFGINLILNALWSYFFFTLKNPTIAFVDLILIWITIWIMIFTVSKVNKISGWLLFPYLIWVSFAGILNWAWL